MARTLHVSRSRGGKTRVELRDGDDLVTRTASDLEDEGQFAKAAARLGVDCAALVAAVDSFERTGVASHPLSREGDGDFTVYVRGLRQTAEEATACVGRDPRQALDAALALPVEAAEPVIWWDGQERLAALDMDVGVDRWDELRLMRLLETFTPRPFMAWTTRRGGLRLMYHATERYTAEEVAAVAYLSLCSSQRYTGLEIKSQTRHPGHPDFEGRCCGAVHRMEQTFDASALRWWLGVRTATDDDVVGWLSARELRTGSRYAHHHCPVSPEIPSHGEPVMVGEEGVFCFNCEARGVTAGSSRPGFFPYSHFVGTGSSLLRRCLECRTHWDHAKFVVEHEVGLVGRYAGLVYSAALLALDPTATRDSVRTVFSVGADFVRMDARWTNLSGEPYVKDVKPILATLPICRPGGRPDRARMVAFEQSFDLTQYGYPSLAPVFGCRIYTQRLRPRDRGRLLVVVQRREYRRDDTAPLRPVYRDPRRRMPIGEAWARIEEACPRVNRRLVELLVAAKGVAEGGLSMTPMVFIAGPTGAAKSGSASLAASICGDGNVEVVWSSNVERMRQAIVDAKATGSFVTFNEVLKEAAQTRRTSVSAMEFVLNLTPDSVSHYMYLGPVRMGHLPVFIWTDTAVPDTVKQNAQIARRIVHVEAPAAVDWERSLDRTGVGHPRRLRLTSEHYAEACNAVLSDVVDRFFDRPRTFEEVANELGFTLLSESTEAEEGRERLRAMFDAVCAAPALLGADAIRWKGRGWRVIAREVESPLRDIWMLLHDQEDFCASRLAAETDWARLLGLREPARLEIRAHGQSRLAVRFRSIEGTRLEHRVNEELR